VLRFFCKYLKLFELKNQKMNKVLRTWKNIYKDALFSNMKRVILFLTFLLISSLSYAFDGPLQVKNQFPLFLPVNEPYLESASIENSFNARLSYSSTYLVKNSTEWSVGLDMEIAELNLGLKKSIKDFIEIGFELPIISFNSGFMDDFLNSYHDAFGFPDYGRSSRPENKFLYEVRRNGVLVIKGENGGIGFGDIRVTLKTPLLRGDPAISIKGNLELPTGDAKNGYGNGSIDGGFVVMIEKKLGEKLKTYGNLGAVFPGDLKGYQNVNLRDFIYGGAGVEADLWKRLSLLGQVFIQGSPFPKTGISSVDRLAVLLTLGGRYYSGKNSFEFSFTEDPNTSGAPDFSLNFSFKKEI
jgi:hypothetical protein